MTRIANATNIIARNYGGRTAFRHADISHRLCRALLAAYAVLLATNVAMVAFTPAAAQIAAG